MALVYVDTHRLNTHIVNVMGFVKNNDAIPLHLFGHEVGNLGVQQVVVAVHHHVGVCDRITSKKVWAYSVFRPVSFHVIQAVNASSDRRFLSPLFITVEKIAQSFAVVALADERRGQRSTLCVDNFSRALATDLFVDAHVTTRAERQACKVERRPLLFFNVPHDGFHFLHDLFNLRDGSRAIHKLANLCRKGQLVRNDKRQKRHSLASARGHFQHAMTLGIKNSLELQHVLVLFWVHIVIREEHLQPFQRNPHGEVLKRGAKNEASVNDRSRGKGTQRHDQLQCHSHLAVRGHCLNPQGTASCWRPAACRVAVKGHTPSSGSLLYSDETEELQKTGKETAVFYSVRRLQPKPPR
eukprot:m.254712 g.254712  ORF g.254712 m.254712 type:complete len:354 (-) comp19149_c0_seq6:142-1203(-)